MRRVERSGLLNADQHFGRRCFSSHLEHFLDRATWLLLALKALFWELAETIAGTVITAVDRVETIKSSSERGNNRDWPLTVV
jgi:hypothetical protein